jgi:ubiquinone/menaquinone biosynthesis C-methylase UbiE
MGTYEGNVERFTGFAGDYDRYRFSPPEIIQEVLCRFAAVSRPELVVDLGCGTGLSTRFWAERADRVVGIDPVDEMIAQAAGEAEAGNVEYLTGWGHETGLPSDGADIVTCSQSFHWMEPSSTLEEVARILHPGGVFAAYHYDAPPVTGIAELDVQAIATTERIYDLEKRHELKRDVRFFPKDDLAASITSSGRFCHTRNIFLHKVDWTSAERMVRGLATLGALQSLRKLGLTEEELGMTALETAAKRHLGKERAPMYLSYSVCIGVMAP